MAVAIVSVLVATSLGKLTPIAFRLCYMLVCDVIGMTSTSTTMPFACHDAMWYVRCDAVRALLRMKLVFNWKYGEQ